MLLDIDDLKPGQLCWLAYFYADEFNGDTFHAEKIRISDVDARSVGFRFADESGVLPPERMSRAEFGPGEHYRLFDANHTFRETYEALAANQGEEPKC